MTGKKEVIDAFNHIIENKSLIPTEFEKDIKTIQGYIYSSDVNYLIFEDELDGMDDVYEMESFNSFVGNANKSILSANDLIRFIKFIEEYSKEHDETDYRGNFIYRLLLRDNFSNSVAIDLAYFGRAILTYLNYKGL